MRNYLSAAIGKTGTRNRIEAVGIARANGWLLTRLTTPRCQRLRRVDRRRRLTRRTVTVADPRPRAPKTVADPRPRVPKTVADAHPGTAIPVVDPHPRTPDVVDLPERPRRWSICPERP